MSFELSIYSWIAAWDDDIQWGKLFFSKGDRENIACMHIGICTKHSEDCFIWKELAFIGNNVNKQLGFPNGSHASIDQNKNNVIFEVQIKQLPELN